MVYVLYRLPIVFSDIYLIVGLADSTRRFCLLEAELPREHKWQQEADGRFRTLRIFFCFYSLTTGFFFLFSSMFWTSIPPFNNHQIPESDIMVEALVLSNLQFSFFFCYLNIHWFSIVTSHIAQSRSTLDYSPAPIIWIVYRRFIKAKGYISWNKAGILIDRSRRSSVANVTYFTHPIYELLEQGWWVQLYVHANCPRKENEQGHWRIPWSPTSKR